MSEQNKDTTLTENVKDRPTGPVTVRMTNDLLFKHLLQDLAEVRKEIICALLHLDESEVEDTIVTNPIIMGETVTDKSVILDVNILMSDRSHIDLEMQVIDYGDWPERSLIYALRNLDNLKSGDDYAMVSKTIQIGFLDYQLFEDYRRFYSLNQLMDIHDHHMYTDKLSVGYVDLTNVEHATEEDKKYKIDKWANFFKADSWEELYMTAEGYPVMEQAISHLAQLTEEERFRLECQARDDQLRRTNGLKRRMEEAKAETKAAKAETRAANKRADRYREQLIAAGIVPDDV